MLGANKTYGRACEPPFLREEAWFVAVVWGVLCGATSLKDQEHAKTILKNYCKPFNGLAPASCIIPNKCCRKKQKCICLFLFFCFSFFRNNTTIKIALQSSGVQTLTGCNNRGETSTKLSRVFNRSMALYSIRRFFYGTRTPPAKSRSCIVGTS